MKDPVNPKKKTRGRPRSETAKTAILSAARVLLSEGGLGSVTMEAVADRAGVGKPTVYRWWPNRHAVAMAALMNDDLPAVRSHAGLSVEAALKRQLLAIATELSSATGRHITMLIAASESESELAKAFRSHFVLAKRAAGRSILERGVAAGELRAGLDLDVALDLLYGPIFFRLLIGHAPIDKPFVGHLLDQVIQGLK